MEGFEIKDGDSWRKHGHLWALVSAYGTTKAVFDVARPSGMGRLSFRRPGCQWQEVPVELKGTFDDLLNLEIDVPVAA